MIIVLMLYQQKCILSQGMQVHIVLQSEETKEHHLYNVYNNLLIPGQQAGSSHVI